MEQMEVKKFRYAAKGNGDLSTSARQSMIDKATNDIQSLQDEYDYDPDTGVYVSKKDQKLLMPQQYTDAKNAVATKLDQQLTQKKMKPLGVRFSASDAAWRDTQGLGRKPGAGGIAPETLNAPAQQQAPQPTAAPAQQPTATGTAEPGTSGATVQIAGPDGRQWTIPKENLAAAQKRGAKLVQYPTPAQSQGNTNGALSVTAPNGKTYNFKTPEAAAQFKKAAGIQ
jgi:hypothetical protein